MVRAILDYSPEVAVFTSADPKGQYFNGYSYVGDNPVNLVDPNGEWGWFARLAWGAPIGGTVGTGVGAIADKDFEHNWWKWTLGGAAVAGAFATILTSPDEKTATSLIKTCLLLCAIGSVAHANLVFSHNDVRVFSINNQGVITYAASPSSGGAVVDSSSGLVIKYNDTIKLATNHDAVTIAGSFGVSPTGDTSNWLMFRNNSAVVRAINPE